MLYFVLCYVNIEHKTCIEMDIGLFVVKVSVRNSLSGAVAGLTHPVSAYQSYIYWRSVSDAVTGVFTSGLTLFVQSLNINTDSTRWTPSLTFCPALRLPELVSRD